MSVQAWIISQLAGFLAPDLASPGALQRAIEEDRARGPAYPPKRLLKHIDFREETIGPDRLFRASPRRGAASRLRLFYIHGGAYVLDLQSIQWNLVAGLATRLGAEVVAPIYPLAPEHGWREGLEAVQRAYLRAAVESGAENVVIFADSAGGGLALALAQALRDAKSPAPAALVLFSPWLDVGVSGPDQPELARRDPALTIEFLREAGRLWAKDLPAQDPRVSPLFGDHSGLPPTIVFSGTRDILDSDAKRLSAASPAVVLREYPNMMHVWPSAPMPEARRALDEAAEFIRRHTASGDPA